MKKLLLVLIISAASIAGRGQLGDLDSTFGINGLVRTDFGFNVPSSLGLDLILHPDGSFYLLFDAGNNPGGGNNPAVVHYFANGRLDSSYGVNGYSEVLPILGFFGEESRAILQTDGKIIVGGVNRSNGTNDFVLVRLTTDGFLDNSFSGDGKQYTDFSLSDDHITALALQGDGKILAAGYSNGLAALARYNIDGTPDNSFSGDGKLTQTGGRATGIAIQNDGKILITFGASVARYLPDGTLDGGFGSGGVATFDFINVNTEIRTVAIQIDSKIVLGGTTKISQTLADFLVIRLESNGTLDNSFSDDGVQTTDFGGMRDDVTEALALQANGKIVLAGTSYSSTGPDIAAARYNTDGSLDNSFSGDGILTTSINQEDRTHSLKLLPDSRIMVAGKSRSGGSYYYFAVRYEVAGNLDPSLDGDGILLDAKPGSNCFFDGLAVQPDGRIVAVGGARNESGGYDLAIARYKQDGALDSSFGGDGRQTIGFVISYGTTVKTQTDGKILAGVLSNGNNGDFAIARLNADGSLDSSFSEDGILLTDFNGGGELVSAIEIQPDGKIVAVGYSSVSGNRDFALARYNSDGTLDNSFSGDGKLVIDLIPPNNEALGLMIQPDGKIVVVGSSNSGTSSDLAVLRLNADGTPDISFSGDGILIQDFGPTSAAQAYDVKLQNDGKIVLTGNVTNPNGSDFLIVRLNSDGSYDNSFASAGILNLDLGFATESAHSLTLQPDGKILAGGFAITPNGFGDFALVRLNPDGIPDSSFAVNGISIPVLEYGRDVITGIVIFGNRVFAAGVTSYSYDFASVAAFLLTDKVTDPLVVNIPDTFALPNGVELNTVYKGYEPASKLTLVTETSGGTAPYTYKWSNGATTASIKVGPSNTKTYSVTVTDANGTTDTASIMIKVVDVRCGYKLEKVLVCHKGHEDSRRSVTLCISEDAVESHLRHGDNLGSCRQSDESDFLTVSAHPNPSRHSFDLKIKSNETVVAELLVWNILGKIIERKTVYTNSTIRIGAWYKPGIYLVEVKYKNKRARTKLIKLPH